MPRKVLPRESEPELSAEVKDLMPLFDEEPVVVKNPGRKNRKLLAPMTNRTPVKDDSSSEEEVLPTPRPISRISSSPIKSCSPRAPTAMDISRAIKNPHQFHDTSLRVPPRKGRKSVAPDLFKKQLPKDCSDDDDTSNEEPPSPIKKRATRKPTGKKVKKPSPASESSDSDDEEPVQKKPPRARKGRLSVTKETPTPSDDDPPKKKATKPATKKASKKPSAKRSKKPPPENSDDSSSEQKVVKPATKKAPAKPKTKKSKVKANTEQDKVVKKRRKTLYHLEANEAEDNSVIDNKILTGKNARHASDDEDEDDTSSTTSDLPTRVDRPSTAATNTTFSASDIYEDSESESMTSSALRPAVKGKKPPRKSVVINPEPTETAMFRVGNPSNVWGTDEYNFDKAEKKEEQLILRERRNALVLDEKATGRESNSKQAFSIYNVPVQLDTNDLTVKQLRVELLQRGLSVTGAKAELRARLEKAIDPKAKPTKKTNPPKKKSPKKKKKEAAKRPSKKRHTALSFDDVSCSSNEYSEE